MNKPNNVKFNNEPRNFERDHQNFDNRAHRGNSECIFCRAKGPTSFSHCAKFKEVDTATRFQFLLQNYLCWHCLIYGHRAFQCCNKSIKECNTFSPCELVCTCKYEDRRFISGTLS